MVSIFSLAQKLSNGDPLPYFNILVIMMIVRFPRPFQIPSDQAAVFNLISDISTPMNVFDTYFFPSIAKDANPKTCNKCGKRILNAKHAIFHQRFIHPTSRQKENQLKYGLVGLSSDDDTDDGATDNIVIP